MLDEADKPWWAAHELSGQDLTPCLLQPLNKTFNLIIKSFGVCSVLV